jgi:hypothetical protein
MERTHHLLRGRLDRLQRAQTRRACRMHGGKGCNPATLNPNHEV